MRTTSLAVAGLVLATVALQGCKHPLAIVGEGDIVEVGNSGRGCTLEQFRAGDSACTENEVSGDYFVNYKAVPRAGWRFVRWEGPCPRDSGFQHCTFGIDGEAVAWWDETYPDNDIPPSTAVFQPIEGQTGHLLAGTPVAGVAYETPTQQGVTGLDGSFQYEEGETVRFSIGATVLGEAPGQERLTPFELAGSPVVSGATISLERASPVGLGYILWRMGDLYPPQTYTWREYHGISGDYFFQRPDPFETVTNITVLLQSLDEDAAPGNGIVIRAGVANLFRGISLDLRPRENPVPGDMTGAGSPGDFPTLHYKLAQANHNHLFSVAHGAVRPAVALQALYKALGLPDRTYATCPGGWDFQDSEVDCRFDANGNLTWLRLESGRVTQYEYDARGNRTRQQTGQSILSWQYNALGDPVQAMDDDDGDGVPERIETWQYDPFGNLTRYEEDDGVDGTVDHVITSEYDAQGKPVRSEEHVGDPREGSTASWQYHTNGRLKRYEEGFTVDTNGRLSTHTQLWQYDPRGRLIRYRQDNEDTEDIGVHWVSVQTREYDDKGNFWLKQYSGEESQESLDMASHFQFDTAGRLVRYRQDNNFDGRREQLQTWQYDAQGRMVRYLRDDGYNSQPDYIESWRYAADGTPARAEGSDAAGRAIYTRTWQYDANGTLTLYTQDGRPEDEGSYDEPEVPIVETWQYTPRGDLTRHTTSRGEDPSLIDSWLYDDDGDLIRYERNHDRLGTPGPIESWQFHTTGWGHLFEGPNIWWLYF